MVSFYSEGWLFRKKLAINDVEKALTQAIAEGTGKWKWLAATKQKSKVQNIFKRIEFVPPNKISHTNIKDLQKYKTDLESILTSIQRVQQKSMTQGATKAELKIHGETIPLLLRKAEMIRNVCDAIDKELRYQEARSRIEKSARKDIQLADYLTFLDYHLQHSEDEYLWDRVSSIKLATESGIALERGYEGIQETIQRMSTALSLNELEQIKEQLDDNLPIFEKLLTSLEPWLFQKHKNPKEINEILEPLQKQLATLKNNKILRVLGGGKASHICQAISADSQAAFDRQKEAIEKAEEARQKAEEEARQKAEEEARLKAEEEARQKAEEEANRKPPLPPKSKAVSAAEGVGNSEAPPPILEVPMVVTPEKTEAIEKVAAEALARLQTMQRSALFKKILPSTLTIQTENPKAVYYLKKETLLKEFHLSPEELQKAKAQGDEKLLLVLQKRIEIDRRISKVFSKEQRQIVYKQMEKTSHHVDSINFDDGTILYIKRDKDAQLSVLARISNEELGKGMSGQVFKSDNFLEGDAVAKIANDDRANDIKAEYAILSNIYGDSKKTFIGIVRRPYAIFHVFLGGKTRMGFLAHRYERDLENQIKEATFRYEDAVSIAGQILQGLVTLKNKKIIHGDIKPANCFCRTVDGKLECGIADFGGAKDISKKGAWPEIFTVGFLSYGDLATYRKGSVMVSPDRFKEFLFKRDVYAMGVTIRELFNAPSFRNRINASEEKIKTLIAKMTDEDWEKRISAEEAFAEFNKIFI